MLGMCTCLLCHIPDRWSHGANWIWPDLAFGFVRKRSENEINFMHLINGCHFSILLFNYKLAPVASFKGSSLLNFKFRNDATRANLQVNKRKLKWQPVWNEVY